MTELSSARAGTLVEPAELASPTDPAALRQVFGTFPSGVTAVAALIEGKPVGISASSFTSVSLAPPMVSVCVAHASTTWPVLSAATRFGVSVLGSDQDAVCRQLASKNGDRFAGLDWLATPDGAVLLNGASAWFDCAIEQIVRAGDHDIVVLRVHGCRADHEIAPLVFHASRFRQMLR